MPTSISLSMRDLNVLARIKDPECDPMSGPLVNHALPQDPHIADPGAYETVSERERDMVLSVQHMEKQLAAFFQTRARVDLVRRYRECVVVLDRLIDEYPQYASARNNRAQAIRRLAGDAMLLANPASTGSQDAPQQAIVPDMEAAERKAMAKTALDDLDLSISLLTPSGGFVGLSPQTARTLSMAHTQRAAIYHMTAKFLEQSCLSVAQDRPERLWTKLDFEESAARDFFVGGRYGNEVAKGLAVGPNPTAKLCGQMVREAMKREYGEGPAP